MGYCDGILEWHTEMLDLHSVTILNIAILHYYSTENTGYDVYKV